jgi:ABC-2 type transport system permease protein
MHPDPRKIRVVAATEFESAIRTKSFIIGILLLPLIMGISILVQVFIAKRVDTRTRTVAIIDRTGELYQAIERAAEKYNAGSVDARGQTIRPRIQTSSIQSMNLVDRAEDLELSDRIRRGELDAFVVIPAEAVQPPPSSEPNLLTLGYHSDNPNDDVARNWLVETVNFEVRIRRFRAAGIDQSVGDRLIQPVIVDNLGLFELDHIDASGHPTIKAAEKVNQVRAAAVPAVLMFAMFFVIMTSAPQLMNSVIEEKMSKISEVLLGSITPFELMLGKLLGNTGIALFLGALYFGGGYAVAAYHGYADVITWGIVLALGLFLILAILLYGSLYMAIGSACNDLKDAQSLMMPVMLLSMFPVFVWTAVLRNPSSLFSVCLSLFPPASPFLMLMRLALHPAPPAWQVGLAVVLTTLSALICIWSAGKIFRTGLLMQGKAPSFRELARWVMAK